jgi:hypothetical protein
LTDNGNSREYKSAAEASEATARYEPRLVRLGDGSEVSVGKLSWLQFTELWQELGGIVGVVLAAGSAGSSQEVYDEVVRQLRQAPAVVGRLVDLTCSLSADEIGERSGFGDVFAVGSAAIQENHGEVVKMLRFLAEAVAAYSATTAQDQQQMDQELTATP